MRRRKAPGDGAGGGLGEALLPPGERGSELEGAAAAAAEQQHQRECAGRRAVIVHRPFDLEAFLQYVWERWTALLRAVSGCLRALLGQRSAPLSLIQASRLEELQARVGVPYDGANPLHQEGLRELWALAFPGKPWPGPKHESWKDMGWQSADPSSDFRAAGLLGLDNLIYLGREEPRLFADLLNKGRGARSSWEYPFGAAGMNVTWALVEALRLRPAPPGAAASGVGGDEGGAVAASAAGRGFLGLLASEEAAFEVVYAAAFELLDRVWLERKATYMEFNAVLKDVRGRVEGALAARPRDGAALRRALGLADAG
ncbi:MAG: engulfment and motility protein [Monoraphidium minutum]|nr:MAG: engulfment and motility protein [Monoraphidium minutum]